MRSSNAYAPRVETEFPAPPNRDRPAGASLAAPETMLPSQLLHPRSAADRRPELRLMLAVLEDAVLTLQRCAGRPGKQARSLVREVENWTSRREPEWPFSFENICTALDLDVTSVRSRLRQIQLAGERNGGPTAPPRITPRHRVAGHQHRVVLSRRARREATSQA